MTQLSDDVERKFEYYIHHSLVGHERINIRQESAYLASLKDPSHIKQWNMPGFYLIRDTQNLMTRCGTLEHLYDLQHKDYWDTECIIESWALAKIYRSRWKQSLSKIKKYLKDLVRLEAEKTPVQSWNVY